MVQFLFPMSAQDRPGLAGADAGAIMMIKAETGSAEALAAVQKQLARRGRDKGEAGAGKAAGRSLPAVALLLPFSLFEGGKSGEKRRAMMVQAAGEAAVAFFCFAMPPGAVTAKKAAPTQAALWAQAAAFAAGHDSFLLLPYRPGKVAAGGPDSGALWESRLTPWLEKAHNSGFKGVLLDCPLFPAAARAAFIAFAGRFLLRAQAAGLRAGIMGALQVPDIPRLLPFNPAYLGFAKLPPEQKLLLASRQPKAGMMGAKALNEAKAPDRSKAAAAPAEGWDKILVSDFIVPVRIGAYAHEKAAAQPVCFNITVEIARPALQPASIMQVFSYDIILDAIERLAAAGPVELVESLAEQLAAFLLEFRSVQRVTARVEKLNLAPRAVGVEISRSRRPG